MLVSRALTMLRLSVPPHMGHVPAVGCSTGSGSAGRRASAPSATATATALRETPATRQRRNAGEEVMAGPLFLVRIDADIVVVDVRAGAAEAVARDAAGKA